ncbi:unnamed protein product [Phytophthora lilii]|uniref:Unnamed protein product n=1 Tax=Phytophthora lilii TaxID=2077276 RepID=A0A9W6WHH4_9STRA|nr:unnamed protein product [Phytophthora lilii]
MMEEKPSGHGDEASTRPSVTGDSYPKCEPQLAKFCCACENDNPVILRKLCRECEAKQSDYSPSVELGVATEVYGLKRWQLSGFRHGSRFCAESYYRIDLDNYMVATFGSKIGWVREIARRDSVGRTLEARQQQKQEERNALLERLVPHFAIYATLIDLEEIDITALRQCSQRFASLAEALDSRRLGLKPNSEVCARFISIGQGDLKDIVDTMEEENFLLSCTDYSQRCHLQIHDGRSRREYQEEVKRELCITYLENSRGLRLPHKWEIRRSLFNDIFTRVTASLVGHIESSLSSAVRRRRLEADTDLALQQDISLAQFQLLPRYTDFGVSSDATVIVIGVVCAFI